MEWWVILPIVIAVLLAYWIYTVGMYAYMGKRLGKKYLGR